MSDLSRRNLLKRLGVGTAVAWSAPVVASMGTPGALAQTANPCLNAALADITTGGEGVVCTGCIPAVRCGTASTAGFGCFCLTEIGRECCVCVEPQNCPGQGSPASQATPCRNNGDCPTNWKCIYSCCNGSPFLGTPDLVPAPNKGICGKPCAKPGVFSAAAAATGEPGVRTSAG